MTYCACPRHHCLPSEHRSPGAKRREGCTRRQWNSPEKSSIYFSIHLWELKNEKFYKYVNDACLRKKWLVNRIKEAIFLTSVRFFIVLIVSLQKDDRDKNSISGIYAKSWAIKLDLWRTQILVGWKRPFLTYNFTHVKILFVFWLVVEQRGTGQAKGLTHKWNYSDLDSA